MLNTQQIDVIDMHKRLHPSLPTMRSFRCPQITLAKNPGLNRQDNQPNQIVIQPNPHKKKGTPITNSVNPINAKKLGFQKDPRIQNLIIVASDIRSDSGEVS
jgi:hypothetical protein